MGIEQRKMLWVYDCVKALYFRNSVNNWEDRLEYLETETGISKRTLLKYLKMMLKCQLCWQDSKGNLFFSSREKLFNHFKVGTLKKKFKETPSGRSYGIDMTNYRLQIQKIIYKEKVSYEQFISFGLELKQDQKIYAAIERQLCDMTGLTPRELQRRSGEVFSKHAENLKELLVRNRLPSLFLYLQDIAKAIGWNVDRRNLESSKQKACKLMKTLGTEKIARWAFDPKFNCVRQTATHWYFNTGILKLEKHVWVNKARELMEEVVSGHLSNPTIDDSQPVHEKVNKAVEYKPTSQKVRQYLERKKASQGQRKSVKRIPKVYYDFSITESMEGLIGVYTLGSKFPEFFAPLTEECFYRTYRLSRMGKDGTRHRTHESSWMQVNPSVTQFLASLTKSVRKAYQRDKYFVNADFRKWVDDSYSNVMNALNVIDDESNIYIKNIIEYGATTWSNQTIDLLMNGSLCLL